MTGIDKQLIGRKAELIQRDLEKLKEFEKVTLDEYMKDYDTRLRVERLLEKIVGRLVDINRHILKIDFNDLPLDYYQSFILIGRHKVVNNDLATNLSDSAGLRNALAHEYDFIDDTKVYRAIKLSLTQIPKYLGQILKKY